MPTSQARIETGNASRYLQQLCKHWSHRLTVNFDEKAGDVAFDEARRVRFEAQDGALLMRVTTASPDDLARTQDTVVNHLRRFAFREELGDVAWTLAG